MALPDEEIPSGLELVTDQSQECGGLRWVGAEEDEVLVGGESFRLSYCYVGGADADPENPNVVDPSLEIALSALGDFPSRRQFVSYRELTPGERRAYLEWVRSGRVGSAPRPFLLLLVSGLEHAILRDRHRDDLGGVRFELERLLQIHRGDPVFVDAAQRLIQVCDLLDPQFAPTPIYASVDANFRDVMPLPVRHFLGYMLKSAGRLDADEGLLFLLQQPGTHLEPVVAQYFRELHCFWCIKYASVGADALGDVAALPRLTFSHKPLRGDLGHLITTDLPDVSVITLPACLEQLFSECAAPLSGLRGEPVARAIANLPVPDRTAQGTSGADLQPRPGAGSRLEARLASGVSQVIHVAELIDILFERASFHPRKLLSEKHTDQVARLLAEQGLGYEPDRRFQLPPSLRPDRQVVLFRSECSDYQDPSRDYLLAQASVIVSALGECWYPSLEPLALDRIEERLPFRHRYTDREIRRLEATRLAILSLSEPRRTFRRRWITCLQRQAREDHLVLGFGIAFKGQRRNPDLAKHARALLLDCERRISIDQLLAAASDLAIPRESFHDTLEERVRSIQASATLTSKIGPPDPIQVGAREALSSTPSLEGLAEPYAALLLALHDRSRTIAEFEELARSRQLSVAGALDQINEWGIERFDALAIREHDGFAITLSAREFLDAQLVEP